VKELGLGRVNVEGIPIAHETRGEGSPIILIHGWSADHRYLAADLEPVFEEHPGWRRTYLDLPGHGATPAPSWLATQDQMLVIVQAFIGAVAPEGPVALVGNSYGGYLALGLVRSMPNRLSGVALVVPDLPAPDGTRVTPGPVTIVEDESIFTDLAPDEEWIPDALVVHDARMLAEIRRHDMPAYRAADRAFLKELESQYAFTGRAARPGVVFARPSLILTGRQDSTVGYEESWRLVEEFPRATYAVLDLAGHHLGRVERPELFRALVGDWLGRMEEGRS
jgi:pimeloyl-ACP methyl ester carboxylesterase